ncbi:MAG: DUF4256 domain-containing protein [Acidobacteria bacterium]|nr:DUF4256 domain-containing protein [Acidobacteriota bacterium]
MPPKKSLSAKDSAAVLAKLKSRFDKNMHRHKGLTWPTIEKKLEATPDKLWSLSEMENTGGEPDVVSLANSAGEIIFIDCSPQSPAGRRSFCYDRAAWQSRKEAKPKNNALDAAAAMGAELLTEAQYRALQQLEDFDTKTSSWILTPPKVRALGGALFCDRRFDTVFTYHNGAESYYAARAFRCWLRV